MADVTGWSDLMSGNVVTAVFNVFNTPMGGYLVFMLYIVISLVLWARTQSIELVAIISLLFCSSFLVTPWFNDITIGVTIVITAFELALVAFKAFAKEKSM